MEEGIGELNKSNATNIQKSLSATVTACPKLTDQQLMRSAAFMVCPCLLMPEARAALPDALWANDSCQMTMPVRYCRQSCGVRRPQTASRESDSWGRGVAGRTEGAVRVPQQPPCYEQLATLLWTLAAAVTLMQGSNEQRSISDLCLQCKTSPLPAWPCSSWPAPSPPRTEAIQGSRAQPPASTPVTHHHQPAWIVIARSRVTWHLCSTCTGMQYRPVISCLLHKLRFVLGSHSIQSRPWGWPLSKRPCGGGRCWTRAVHKAVAVAVDHMTVALADSNAVTMDVKDMVISCGRQQRGCSYGCWQHDCICEAATRPGWPSHAGSSQPIAAASL